MNALIPTDTNAAFQLANMMSKGKLVPTHLRDSPGDCLMVIEQAMRWGMSPFAVAQCTSVIQGKLMFEGKLVSAALHTSGLLKDRLREKFEGEGASRAVIMTGMINGETEPRVIRVTLAEAKTTNGMWQKQPDQQLIYYATRAWARRHAPEVMLGVYSPEEFEAPKRDDFKGTTIDASATLDASPPDRAEITDPAAWMRQLDMDLAHAQTGEEVDEILAAPDVQMAQDKARGAFKDRLNGMILAAIERTANAETSAPNEDATA